MFVWRLGPSLPPSYGRHLTRRRTDGRAGVPRRSKQTEPNDQCDHDDERQRHARARHTRKYDFQGELSLKSCNDLEPSLEAAALSPARPTATADTREIPHGIDEWAIY